MSSSTKTIFIDTNGFIQVRDLKDVPWRDLFPGVQAVDVVVASCVIEELDEFKTGLNQRRRDRARLALNLIEKASCENGFALTIREEPVRVRLVVSNARAPDWSAYPSLDPASADDRLVAEALSFGQGAAVFSHDTGPRIRARIAGVEAYEPIADWMLPPEASDDQRKIGRLQRELELERQRHPNILARFDDIDPSTSQIAAIRPILPPLETNVANALVHRYLAKHPPASHSSTNSFIWQMGGASAGQIECYEDEYADFRKEVHEFFFSLHRRVNLLGSVVAIRYSLENNSGVAAEGLRVEFDLGSGGSLLSKREDLLPGADGPLELPTPPKYPERGFLDSITGPRFEIPTLQDHLRPRDPVAFHWFKRPRLGATHGAMQCEQFRATRRFGSSVFIRRDDGLARPIDLSLDISAANLPAPVRVSAKVAIVERSVDWSDGIVRGIIPADLIPDDL